MRAVYRFEEIDESLELVPLAARRALDRARTKLSLDGWRRLPLDRRAAIAEAGAADEVDVEGVRRLLADSDATATEGRPEPDAGAVPALLSSAAPTLTSARWAALRALDRWALESLAARGRTDALAAALAELGHGT